MAVDNKGVEVKKGDSIVIKAQGLTVRGKVATVDNYGGDDGWQIEITEANVPGGYSSWKQRFDGGHIAEVNGEAV